MDRNRTFFKTKWEYEKEVESFNRRYGAWMTMEEAYLPYLERSQEGKNQQILHPKPELIKVLKNSLNTKGAFIGEHVHRLSEEGAFIEEVDSFFVPTAYAAGKAIAYVEAEPKRFTYRRIVDPETTAYMDLYDGEINWIGYQNPEKKIKYRAIALLAYYLAAENPSELNMNVILDRANTSQNRLCSLYEGLRFGLDGFFDCSQFGAAAACYRYNRLDF